MPSDWILTATGQPYHFGAPKLGPNALEDIATALSNICRFAGHVREFYSVAEHSVLVSHLVDPKSAFEALMHDAHEAYVGDVTTPLKRVMRTPHASPYDSHERFAEIAVRGRFRLPIDLSPEVHAADKYACDIERAFLLPDHPEWPTLFIRSDDIGRLEPRCFPPKMARARFLQRFYEVTA